MRDRTRSYTTDLPRIGLPFLSHMRSRLADAEPGTKLYTQTESGTLYTFRQADSYAMTINGVTRAIRTTTTQAGYGVREWYVCPHCMKRVAKLYIGKKDHPYDFPKPKGMRWATFDRKRAELSVMEMAYWQAFSPVVGRITGVIERKAGKAARGIGLTL